jgi:competence protein ComEC
MSAVLAFISSSGRGGTDHLLRVSFLDVGQGDAIFIQTPEGIDMLIDGGKDTRVLRELGKLMSPLDKTIDIVVATHPDADHIGGLSEVFDRYAVKDFVYTSIESDTSYYERLTSAVAQEPSVRTHEITSARIMNLGSGVSAHILYPDREIISGDTNDASVVIKLEYGSTSVLLTGDAGVEVEQWLVRLYGGELKSDILKAGHHGSRTSSSKSFVEQVAPRVAIISAGKDNSYGHPHKEVLDTFSLFGIDVFSTAQLGTISFTSDGGEPILVK